MTKLCPCGRPTVTPYHDHCAICIRHATPGVDRWQRWRFVRRAGIMSSP